MALESSFNFIDDLTATNPAAGDNISEGDDHIRGIKNAVKGSFTSLGSAAVTKTAAQINDLVSKSTTQTITGLKTMAVNLNFDTSSAERLIRFNNGTQNIYLYQNNVTGDFGLYDQGNARIILIYDESADTFTVRNLVSSAAALTSPVINTGVSGTAGVSRMIRETVQATTSGSTKDFTGIPSWVKRITILFDGVSTNGTSNISIRIGDSGGLETTGYTSRLTEALSTGNTFFNSGISWQVFSPFAAANLHDGHVVIENITGNEWIQTGVISGNANGSFVSNGSKTLTAVLDRLQISTSDTFDAGQVNIIYEG